MFKWSETLEAPRAFARYEAHWRSCGQHTTPSAERNEPSLPSTWHFQGRPAHTFGKEAERVCCLILTLPKGPRGNSPFPLCLNLPIKGTLKEIVYSAKLTGPTETQNLIFSIVYYLLLLFYLHIKEDMSFINLSCKIYAALQTERDKFTSRPYDGWYELTSFVTISSLRLNDAEGETTAPSPVRDAFRQRGSPGARSCLLLNR